MTELQAALAGHRQLADRDAGNAQAPCDAARVGDRVGALLGAGAPTADACAAWRIADQMRRRRVAGGCGTSDEAARATAARLAQCGSAGRDPLTAALDACRIEIDIIASPLPRPPRTGYAFDVETHDPRAWAAGCGEIREGLLRLHQSLLDWERRGHERVHGRMSATELLQVLLHDPEFAWLRPISESVVHIDEMLADEGTADEDAILVQVRALASPDADGTPYAQRYLQAIQESPDAVLAHKDLLALLRRQRAPR